MVVRNQDDIVSCRFSRPRDMQTFTGSGRGNASLDNEYYIFLAWGGTYGCKYSGYPDTCINTHREIVKYQQSNDNKCYKITK